MTEVEEDSFAAFASAALALALAFEVAAAVVRNTVVAVGQWHCEFWRQLRARPIERDCNWQLRIPRRRSRRAGRGRCRRGPFLQFVWLLLSNSYKSGSIRMSFFFSLFL